VAVNDPFIRDQVQKTTMRKSDSFFNKVEAAENGQTRQYKIFMSPLPPLT
jgi:hypothetical protein